MAAADLTPERVRELLSCDPDTGAFTWRVDRKSGAKAGDPAGCIDSCLGYVRIWIDGAARYGHILAWMLQTGECPSVHIDHIDGRRSNNAFSNLRLADQGINQQNRHVASRSNRTGLLGVSAIKPKKAGGVVRYRAVIAVAGKIHRLGNFYCPHAAHEAYLDAKRRLHAGCTI